MQKYSFRIGYWSALTVAVLVLLIDACMIASTIIFPMTTITTIESYADSFTNWQMLPFIPSLILAPVFVALMLSIHHYASEEKRFFSQLGFSFGVICAAILGIHYYIQLTVVQQGLLSHQTSGLWFFSAPNPNSLFWTLSALGYGFMGLAVLSTSVVFSQRRQQKIKWLLVANGLVGILFLVGNALGFFAANIIASFVWGVLFPVACILIAAEFKQAQNQLQRTPT